MVPSKVVFSTVEGPPEYLPSLKRAADTPTTLLCTMSNESANAETTFGYLSMLEFPDHGYFGGYLIVSPLGRPLEFHCTAPIVPSRAQKILYGATLEPYLLAEQIAGALLQVAKLSPELIITNREVTLQARVRGHIPMVALCGRVQQTVDFPASSNPDPSNPDASPPVQLISDTVDGFGTFSANAFCFQLPTGYESEKDQVTQLLALLGRHVDLAEPFGRIEEAIREAQRLGGSSADTYDHAA
jgi:hypothetical protein